MKRTMGFQKDDLIFQSEEFNDFNEFTVDLRADKVFDYAKEIQKNCPEDQYPQAWGAALRGAKQGEEAWTWSEEGCSWEFYVDEGIITELYSFLFEKEGEE